MINGRGLQKGRLARTLRRLDQKSEQSSFLLIMSVFPLIGYLVPLLPTQLLLVTLSYRHPNRWLMIAVIFLLATSVGAFLTSVLVQFLGEGVKIYLLSSFETARHMATFISIHGLWAVALLALLPWPPRSAVLICAFVGLNPVAIAITIFFGRIVPTFFLAWLSAHSPDVLRRMSLFKDALHQIVQFSKR